MYEVVLTMVSRGLLKIDENLTSPLSLPPESLLFELVQASEVQHNGCRWLMYKCCRPLMQ